MTILENILKKGILLKRTIVVMRLKILITERIVSYNRKKEAQMKCTKIVTRRLIEIILFMQTVSVYTISPITEWDSLLKSNQQFVKNHTFAKQRAPLKNQQNPSIIVLSCADSRVAPELIFNQKLGSLFVVRVAGQVVDDVVIDSIEFAVGNFDVRLIVVLGHSDCGAVAGALKHLQKNSGVIDTPRGYLNAVLIPIEKAITEAGIDVHGANALEKSIQANVTYVANQLKSRSKTISDVLNTGQLILIGAEYSLGTGGVNQLFSIPHGVINKNIDACAR